MNRYLLMAAAALFAGTGVAEASHVHSFTFGTVGGGSYCDGGTITTHLSGGRLAAWKHTNNNCAGGVSYGAGLLMKVKGLGKVWWVSDNMELENGLYTEYLSYTFPKLIKDGGAWTQWLGFSGVSEFEGNSGVLNKVTAGAHGIVAKGSDSTAGKVARLLGSRRP